MNHYETLEVNQSASIEVIKAAYRILAQKYHPDKNNSEESTEKMKLINTAYAVLSSPNDRKEYDEHLNKSFKEDSKEETYKDLEILRIEILDTVSLKTNVLELSEVGIVYKGVTLIKSEIEIINIKIIEQKTALRNFGDKYSLKIGSDRKNIEILLDNKSNNGQNELFQQITSSIIVLFSTSIILKILKEIETFGGYNLNDLVEFNAKGVFLIANRNKHQEYSELFIPYQDLQLDFYNGNLIFLNKKNLLKLELKMFNYLKNGILLSDLANATKLIGAIGTKESPQERKWKQELNNQKEQAKIFNEARIRTEQINFYQNELEITISNCWDNIQDSLSKGEGLSDMYEKYINVKQKEYINLAKFENIYNKLLLEDETYVNEDEESRENKIGNKLSVKQQVKKFFIWVFGFIFGLFLLIILIDSLNKDKPYSGNLNNKVKTSYQNIDQEKHVARFKTPEEAFNWWTVEANKENKNAQYALGLMYYHGIGTSLNHTIAANLFEKSAKQGNTDAQYNLGKMYYGGEGVEINDQKAIELFTLAANNGNTDAQFNLGYMYYKREGVNKNYEEAIKLFTLAANSGNTDAQFNLGYMYYKGEGVDKNYQEAIKWVTLAANKGDPEAKKMLNSIRE